MGLTARFSNPERPDQEIRGQETDTVCEDVDTQTIRLARQKRLRLSSAEIDDLVSTYESGIHAAELAQRFGIHRHTVESHLKKRQVQIRRTRWKLNDDQVRQAARRYRSGASLADLGDELEVDPQTVARHLRALGLDTRHRPGWTYRVE